MKNRTGFALLAATMVLGIAVSASAAPVTSTITLGTGWNMIALPTVPLNPAPDAVLQDLANVQDVDGNIVRWDPINRSNVQFYSFDPESFGNLLIGDGYWVLKTTSGSLTASYQGVDVSGDHWISLPRKGWTLIGYPNNTPASKIYDDVLVTNGIETKSMEDAIGAGWVNDFAFTWDNGNRSLLSVSLSSDVGDLVELEKGKGYWFQTDRKSVV